MRDNVQGKGIEGARAITTNLRDLEGHARLGQATGRGLQRSRLIRPREVCGIHTKDLTDIGILHLATAPQTKSVPYAPPAPHPADKFELIF